MSPRIFSGVRRWDENLAACFPSVDRDEGMTRKEIEVVSGLYGRTVVDNIGGEARRNVEVDLRTIAKERNG